MQWCSGIEPNSVEILYRLGIAYLNLYNLGEAERHLNKAYLLNPEEKEISKALERIKSLSLSPLKPHPRSKPTKQKAKED